MDTNVLPVRTRSKPLHIQEFHEDKRGSTKNLFSLTVEAHFHQKWQQFTHAAYIGKSGEIKLHYPSVLDETCSAQAAEYVKAKMEKKSKKKKWEIGRTFKMDTNLRQLDLAVVQPTFLESSPSEEEQEQLTEMLRKLFKHADKSRKYFVNRMVLPLIETGEKGKWTERMSCTSMMTSIFTLAKKGELYNVKNIVLLTSSDEIATEFENTITMRYQAACKEISKFTYLTAAYRKDLNMMRNPTGNTDHSTSSSCFLHAMLHDGQWTRPTQKTIGPCSGDMQRISSFMNHGKELGCAHEADVLLCRIGVFIDWNDPEQVENVVDKDVCTAHLLRLGKTWGKSTTYRVFNGTKDSPFCSFPTHIVNGKKKNSTVPKGNKFTRKEAQEWLERGYLLQVGSPICNNHRAEIKRIPTQQSTQSVTTDDEEPEGEETLYTSRHVAPPVPKKTPSTAKPAIKAAVKKLANVCGINRVLRQINYSTSSDRNQRRKARAVTEMLEAICEVLAAGDAEMLKCRVLSKLVPAAENSNKELDYLLHQVKTLYYVTKSKRLRYLVLATVASLPRRTLAPYFPNLSKHTLTKARQVAPLVTVVLPFDERIVKMDDGGTRSLPNLMRMQNDEELYRMYKRDLQEKGESALELKRTTALQVIQIVAPTKRRSLLCVDEKLADGMEAFDDASDMCEELYKEELILKEDMDMILRELISARNYISGDYKVHIKPVSRISDHCARHALSDPENALFAQACNKGANSHEHDLSCERCEQVSTALDLLDKEVQDSAREDESGKALIKRKHREIKMRKIRERVEELKRHVLRTSLSNDERTCIVDKLQEDEALVVFDWSQKLMPMHPYERQSEYYAKAGTGVHITDALSKKGDEIRHHTFCDIFSEGTTQDSTAVAAIIRRVLTVLADAGIKKVWFRSDNAGCYRSAPLMGTLAAQDFDARIVAYFFSEAQSGKGPCDRGASLMKRKIRDSVNALNPATHREEYFKALSYGTPLAGFSYSLASVKINPQTKGKMTGITKYSAFAFENDGVRIFRHLSIGEGRKVPRSELGFTSGELIVERSGGFDDPTSPEFWHYPHRTVSRPRHPTLTLLTEQCPEEYCSAEFSTMAELERHLEIGKHVHVLASQTLRDLCIEITASGIESTRKMQGILVEKATSGLLKSSTEPKPKGWALKVAHKINPNDKDARELVKKFFKEKREQDLRAQPREAEMRMKNAQTADGIPLISPDGYLTIQQIKSIICNLLKKEREAAATNKGAPPAKRGKVIPAEPVVQDEEEEEEEYQDVKDAESDDEDVLFDVVVKQKSSIFGKDGEEEDKDDE